MASSEFKPTSTSGLCDRNTIVVDDVRISPAELVFSDAFEWRKYRKEIVIHNCGKKTACVKILQPSSFHFKIKTCPRGLYISPGLKTIRYISFTFSETIMVTSASIPIIVNTTSVDVKLQVTFSVPSLTATPAILDFGVINIGNATDIQTIEVTNEGTKVAQFAVDVVFDNIQVIVSPVKGTVDVGNTLKMKVQLVGTSLGTFEQEFWIKSSSPVRLIYRCVVINPQLLFYQAVQTSDFVLVQFPYTYVGAFREHFVVIYNDSSLSAMFCILDEWKKCTYPWNEALKVDQCLKHFQINVTEGRINANEGQMLLLRYSPVQDPLDLEGDDDFFFHFSQLVAVRLDCTELLDYKQDDIPGFEQTIEESSGKSNLSIKSSIYSNVVVIRGDEPTFKFPLYSLKKILIFGIAEVPNVSVVPDMINLTQNIILKQKEVRVLNFTNNSRHLPITVKYLKSTFIEASPISKEIKPQESFEFEISLKPQKLGAVQRQIKFNLICRSGIMNETCLVGSINVPINYECILVPKPKEPIFNMGITPALYNEVGRYVDNLAFNTSANVPRAAIIDKGTLAKWNDETLVAFPNDRCRSLRPWTSTTPICTILTRIPRGIEFCEVERTNRQSYYKKFLKSKRCKLPPIELKSSEQPKNDTSCGLQFKDRPKIDHKLLPLSPIQLYKIKIYPRKIDAGKIAQLSTFKSVFWVENQNQFPIDILIKVPNVNLLFVSSDRKMVKPNEVTSFEFLLPTAKGEGFFEITINVIVNDNHLFQVNVYGEIVARCLHLNKKLFEFEPGDPLVDYVDIYNPFTTPISFSMDAPEGILDVEPLSGAVEGGNHLLCAITYNPGVALFVNTEISLLTEGKMDKVIAVKATRKKTDVYFEEPVLNFGEIGLNDLAVKYVYLKNNCFYPVKLQNIEESIYLGFAVVLTENTIPANSKTLIRVEVKLLEVGPFSMSINLQIQESEFVSLKVEGIVIFPIVIFKPSKLMFRKIPNFSFDRVMFLVENTSSVDALVEFDLTNYRQFKITNSLEIEDEVDFVRLQPMQQKQFCMHFHPIDVASSTFKLNVVINQTEAIDYCSRVGLSEELTPERKTSKSDLYNKYPNVIVQAPTTIPCVSFTKTNFKFKYYPHPEYQCCISEQFFILNESTTTAEFCIRLDEVNFPFSLAVTEGDVQVTSKSISGILEYEESVLFTMIFEAEGPGEYNCKIPVYVKDQMEGAIYKYLYFQGVYPEPVFKVSPTVIYLEPVPLRTYSEVILDVSVQYHALICAIKMECSDKDVTITSEDGQVIIDPRNIENQFRLVVSFTTTNPKILDTKGRVYCKCGKECTFMIKGCSENCNITTHSYLSVFCENTFGKDHKWSYSNIVSQSSQGVAIELESLSLADVSNLMEVAVNTNTSVFPFFPSDQDTCEYANHMRAALSAAEKWMNQTAFFGDIWYTIPDLIKEPQISSPSKGKSSYELPYLVLLKYLAGPAVQTSFKFDITAWVDDLTNTVKYLWLVYDNIKQMLTSAGAYLPNVEPENLLKYEHYEHYQKNILPNNNPDSKSLSVLSYNTFYLLSKQSWLDLILQTFKVFKFNFQKNQILTSEHLEILPYFAGQSMVEMVTSLNYENSVYHSVENVMLFWLESVYNNNTHLFGRDLPDKSVKLFQLDLRDGVVLAVITAAYCPFLINHFKFFYWRVENNNEKIYNAAKLLLAWNLLNFGCKITIDNILRPNSLDMLFLVMNLFELLPSLWPSDEMELSAPLGHQSSKSISITNENDFTVKYVISFFTESEGSFTANPTELILSPKKTASVKILYSPSRMKNAEAHLLFSGECSGYHSAKSKVYKVFGSLDLTPEKYQTHVLKTDSFKLKRECVKIESPYKTKADYDIYVFVGDLGLERHVMKWTQVKKQFKGSRRLNFDKDVLSCDENGFGELETLAFTAWIKESTVWILFTNEEIGDFLFQFKITSNIIVSKWSINVPVNNLFLNCECCCQPGLEPSPKCGKNIKVLINSINIPEWEINLENLIYSCEKEEDKDFWQLYHRSYAGMSVQRRMADDCPLKNFTEMYIVQVPYFPMHLTLEKPNPKIQFRSLVKIWHIEGPQQEIVFHINSKELPKDLKFYLRSLNSGLRRLYTCKFILCNDDDK